MDHKNMGVRFILILLGACLTVVACGGDERASIGMIQGQVVYGVDNRMDLYQYPDPAWVTRVQQSTVALVNKSAVNSTNPNNVILNGTALGTARSLCPDQQFRDQPTAAFCSGTLVDDDLVLTAGHCIRTAKDCSNTRFVFGYDMESATTRGTITTADVFSCKSIVTRAQTSTVDYGLIRLDRKATPRFAAAPLRTAKTALENGTPLMVAGFPSGLPVKLDDGGTVRDGRSATLDFFVAATDTFGGNSGSGVYDLTTGEVAGILVRGETDYVLDSAAGCYRVNFCSETGCGGEESTYLFQATNAFCAVATSARLCPVVCGNGKCETGESNATCPVDCPLVPAAWKCSAANYGTGDGCHCACGAPDPDCIVTPTPVIGCRKTLTHCSATGTCIL